MRDVYRLTVLICLLFASLARAGQSEDIALDKLPQNATDTLKVEFPGAELLHARKEMEDGKECYVVTIMHKGRQSEHYVSLGGRHVFAKQAFSFTVLPRRFAGVIALSLLPGAIAGAIARLLVQAAKGNRLSVLSEWLAAWVGAVIGISVILSQMTTVPREKDVVVFSLICAVCGGIAASVVETVGLTIQSFRGHRIVYRRWILSCCVVVCIFLCLSILVDMLRIDRENEYFRAQAMKLPPG